MWWVMVGWSRTLGGSRMPTLVSGKMEVSSLGEYPDRSAVQYDVTVSNRYFYWDCNKIYIQWVSREIFNCCNSAVCYTRSDKCYTSSKCIAIFNVKICYYVVLFIPFSSKLEFLAMQNFESKLFPVCLTCSILVCLVCNSQKKLSWKDLWNRGTSTQPLGVWENTSIYKAIDLDWSRITVLPNAFLRFQLCTLVLV